MKISNFDRCNLIALRQATRQTTQLYESFFETVGLRATQFGILQRLDGTKPVSINDLAALMIMDAATMGRAIKPLEREGYVSIGRGQDGRTRVITLTKAGAAKLKIGWIAWRKATETFEARIGGSEQAAKLRASLRNIIDVVSLRL